MIYDVVPVLVVQQSLTYTHIDILFFFCMIFHYGLSQDIEYSSLCYTVGPCCLPTTRYIWNMKRTSANFHVHSPKVKPQVTLFNPVRNILSLRAVKFLFIYLFIFWLKKHIWYLYLHELYCSFYMSETSVIMYVKLSFLNYWEGKLC